MTRSGHATMTLIISTNTTVAFNFYSRMVRILAARRQTPLGRRLVPGAAMPIRVPVFVMLGFSRV